MDNQVQGDSGSEAQDRQLDFHPGMGMRWEITKTAEDSGGEVFEATNWLDPGMPGPPVHVHPTSEETFEVLEGVLDVFLDGSWSAISPGETATVPPGAPHTLRNGNDGETVVVTRIKPAGDSEELFRTMHRVITEGKITKLPPDGPRSAIYAAMVFNAYPGEIKTTKPPNAVFKGLAMIGRTLGFKLND